MLILYPETLLNSFTSTNNFLIASLEFSAYGIMLSANYDSFASSFPIWIPFICCLIALVRTFSIMLNKSCKSGHPWSWRKCFLCFTTENVVGHRFVIMMRYVPSAPTLLIGFNVMNVEFCQKLFLRLLRWSYDFLQFVNMVCHTDWVADTDPSLHPWNKCHLLIV